CFQAMKMSKVGNQTNSQDPQAVNSRVFVGNLNTFQCSKTDVERMFQRYGRLAGISMHKGYAFVQFTNPFDARSACLGEDGRTVLSQILDVNMVAEPKPHQTGRKRQNVSKTGNDCYYASTAFPPRLAPPLKRPRLMPPTRAQHPKLQKQQSTANTGTIPDLNQLKVYSNPDILICGNCREMFTELGELLEHKRNYCKLRFTCKCHTFNGAAPRDSTTALLCVLCKLSFPSAWELMVHAQAAHMINIYELGTRAPSPSRSPSLDQPKESSPSPQDFQEIKATDCEERAEEEELDGHELIPSPDSGKSTDNEAALSPIKIRSDVNGLDHEDCDELIHVENTTQACIMHTLSIVSFQFFSSSLHARNSI
ncbi:HNRPC protein, partial [Pseudoatta argentina]